MLWLVFAIGAVAFQDLNSNREDPSAAATI
jgi:hypothetical protein